MNKVLSTLCYLERDNCFLMLYRNKKKADPNAGKWVGVGGKLETGETPEACVRREVLEETGLILGKIHFYGVVHFVSDVWPDEEMYLFGSRDFSGKDPADHEDGFDCNEGDLKWIPKDKVLSLNLWEGDPYFLKKMLAGESEIEMTLRYSSNALTEARDELTGRSLM